MDMTSGQQHQPKRVVTDRIPMWQSSPYFLLSLWNFFFAFIMLCGCGLVVNALDYNDIDAALGAILLVAIIFVCMFIVFIIGRSYHKLQEEDKQLRELRYNDIENKATSIATQFQIIQERYGDLQEKYLELQKQLSHEEV